jgi:hypothetical protein
MTKILKKMTYQYHKEGSTVFDFNEMGDKMYMIIDGSVDVLIPQNVFQRKSQRYKAS